MRLLLIEDEIDLAKSIKKGLEKESFTVDIVSDAKKALRRVELYRDDYDLVILDWILPGKEGIEKICREARAGGVTVPILMLTAKFDTADKVRALDAGADDYMVKPFSLEELVARIRAVLRRPKASLPTVLKVRELELDTSTRVVKLSGREIKLSVKEFAILEYLMRHPNQVVSRNQILDHLWGFDFNSFSNIVDVHVKNLRKKLNNENYHILQTERGVGYKIRSD
ncbi:MAG: response regulator transcription factor [bacterium]|nr:response regulator transcription factor [bacterium]